MTTVSQSEPPKRGAPPGNRNGTTHGVRGYLSGASLPKGASYIRRITNALRRQVEAAVVEAKGELTLYDAALCQTIARHESRALLVQRWLRLRCHEMTDADRLGYAREVSAASDSRDKALRSLGLDRVAAADDFDFPFAIEAPQTAIQCDANGNGTPEPPTAADEPAEPLDVQTPLEEPRPEPIQ